MPRKKKEEAAEAASEPVETTESKPRRRPRKTEVEATAEKPARKTRAKAASPDEHEPKARAQKTDASETEKKPARREARRRPVSEPKPVTEGSAQAPLIGFVFRGADGKAEPKPAVKRTARERKPPAKKAPTTSERPRRRDKATKPVALKKETRPPLPAMRPRPRNTTMPPRLLPRSW